MERRDAAKTFRDLIAWQHAHAFIFLDVSAVTVYPDIFILTAYCLPLTANGI
jgi:hypothetical protein